MTITTEVGIAQFNGDSSTTIFVCNNFVIQDQADLDVVLYDTATLVETLQTLTTHYTVTIGTTSITVTFVTAPPTGTRVTVTQSIPIVQDDVDFKVNQAVQPVITETAFDKLTLICQQLSNKISKSVRLIGSSLLSDITIPEGADKFIKWTSAGTALEVVGLADIGAATEGSGIDITSSVISVDIPTLTEDTTPVIADDFVMTYDASAAGLKKTKLNNLGVNDASYLTLGTNTKLTSERVLTAGTAISFVDGGAGSTLTINSTASTTAATEAQQEAASSNTVFATPLNQHFHPSAAKAYVRFNGSGTPAIDRAYKVSSITDNGVGDWTINLTNSFQDANYTVAGVSGAGTAAAYLQCGFMQQAPSTSSYRFMVYNGAFAATDVIYNSLVIFGEL